MDYISNLLPLSLARANIGYHWKLFTAAILVLMLSGCLIYVATGISVANFRSLSAYERSLDVDFFIVKEKREGEKGSKYKAIPTQIIFEVETYPEIMAVETLQYTHEIINVQTEDEKFPLNFRVLPYKSKSMLVPEVFDEPATDLRNVVGCQRRSKIRPCGGVKVCQYGYA